MLDQLAALRRQRDDLHTANNRYASANRELARALETSQDDHANIVRCLNAAGECIRGLDAEKAALNHSLEILANECEILKIENGKLNSQLDSCLNGVFNGVPNLEANNGSE